MSPNNQLADRWQPIETAPTDGTPILMWLRTRIDRHYPSAGICDFFCIGLHQYGRWVSLEVEDCGSMGGEYTGWMSDWSHARRSADTLDATSRTTRARQS